MKGRLKGAQTGHSLLKKKADALTLRFRQILGKIIEVCFTLHWEISFNCDIISCDKFSVKIFS